MAELRKMQRNQLVRINKEELIDSILAAQEEAEAPVPRALDEKLNAVMAEMAELKKIITSPESFIAKKFAELHDRIDKQAEIISSQQRYLEMLDRRERATNIVVLGLPDEGEALEGAVTDTDKLEKVWEKVGVTGVGCQHRRLGAETDGRRRNRPLLLTVQDKEMRSRILGNAKNLKTAGGIYAKIYVKKDVHPGVRKEWQRLREAEAREKERPENAGCNIRLDTRQRKLYRDNEVIDTWSPQFF